ncbi:MAG: hypothetical protein ACFFDI_17035, partial [Promethearchaeota archaeon]
DQKATYHFPTPVLLKSITKEKDSYYMLDEKNYCAFVINDAAYSITQIISNRLFWTLEEVLSAIQESKEFTISNWVEFTKDVIVYLTYLGQRGYLEKLFDPT